MSFQHPYFYQAEIDYRADEIRRAARRRGRAVRRRRVRRLDSDPMS